jgi:hypothetical protein
LSCVEAEIISDNLANMKFFKELPVYGHRIGCPEMDWSEIFTSFCITNIVRKSHEGIPVNSSWLRNSIRKFGLRGISPIGTMRVNRKKKTNPNRGFHMNGNRN